MKHGRDREIKTRAANDPQVFTMALVEAFSVISNHCVGLRFKHLLSSFRWWRQIKDETWPCRGIITRNIAEGGETLQCKKLQPYCC